jgi:hypothetical protein
MVTGLLDWHYFRIPVRKRHTKLRELEPGANIVEKKIPDGVRTNMRILIRGISLIHEISTPSPATGSGTT